MEEVGAFEFKYRFVRDELAETVLFGRAQAEMLLSCRACNKGELFAFGLQLTCRVGEQGEQSEAVRAASRI